MSWKIFIPGEPGNLTKKLSIEETFYCCSIIAIVDLSVTLAKGFASIS